MTKISHFKISKMSQNTATESLKLNVWIQQPINYINCFFHSESNMFFSKRYICWLFHFHILGQNCPCRLCLPIQIQIMKLVTKSAIFNNPTPKMLLWLHLAELIFEKIIIKSLEVHTINIWGPKPHGIVLISNGSQEIRQNFHPEKM